MKMVSCPVMGEILQKFNVGTRCPRFRRLIVLFSFICPCNPRDVKVLEDIHHLYAFGDSCQ